VPSTPTNINPAQNSNGHEDIEILIFVPFYFNAEAKV